MDTPLGMPLVMLSIKGKIWTVGGVGENRAGLLARREPEMKYQRNVGFVSIHFSSPQATSGQWISNSFSLSLETPPPTGWMVVQQLASDSMGNKSFTEFLIFSFFQSWVGGSYMLASLGGLQATPGSWASRSPLRLAALGQSFIFFQGDSYL